MTVVHTDADALMAYRGWLARRADAIASETAATELGRRARRAYVDRQAVRNLLRCAETSASVSDLLDYVKVRIARHPQWRREAFGPTLLEQLEQLRAWASGEDVPAVSAHAAPHLELCRLFLRQLAAAYAYSIAVDIAAPRGTVSMPPRPPARPPAAPPARRREGERRGRPVEAAPVAAEPPAPAATAATEAAPADAVVEGAPPEPAAEATPTTEAGEEVGAETTEHAPMASAHEEDAVPAGPAAEPPLPTSEGDEPIATGEPHEPEGAAPATLEEAPPMETTE